MKKIYLLAASFSLAAVAVLAPVFVLANENSSPRSNQPNTETEFEKSMDTPDRVASRSALKNEKLEQDKLTACEDHQDEIQNRSSSITQRAQNQLNVFADIAARVESFYNNKMLPKGITVSNYSGLVTDIASKKAAVEAALKTAQTDASKFSCTGVDPKSQINNFRVDMQLVINALKDYRKSVRNLIVAVRTAYNAATEATTSAKE